MPTTLQTARAELDLAIAEAKRADARDWDDRDPSVAAGIRARADEYQRRGERVLAVTTADRARAEALADGADEAFADEVADLVGALCDEMGCS